MQEAVSWMMSGSIRLLFVCFFIHCQPVHPNELWENFKDALSDDFLRLYGDHTRDGHEKPIPSLSVNMWMLKFGLNAPTGGPRIVLREENC